MRSLSSVLLAGVTVAGASAPIYLDEDKQKNLLLFVRAAGSAVGTVVFETQDPAGNWYPIHSEAFTEAGQPDPISISEIPIRVIRANLTPYTSGTFYAGVNAN